MFIAYLVTQKIDLNAHKRRFLEGLNEGKWAQNVWAKGGF
jgi:hypothetical protein